MKESGTDIIRRLEAHCNEELNCSRRMKMQIASSLDRLIKENADMKRGIEQIMNGHKTFDPSYQKSISLSKRELGE